MTNISGFSKKTKSNIVYPDCKSAIKPVPHNFNIPVPVPPSDYSLDDINSSPDEVADSHMDEDYLVESLEKVPHFFNQEDLNDLVRDLSLSKEKSEVLRSRLQQRNLLEQGTKISMFRSRHEQLAIFFTQKKRMLASVMTLMDSCKN
jgi:hypothetical protein